MRRWSDWVWFLVNSDYSIDERQRIQVWEKYFKHFRVLPLFIDLTCCTEKNRKWKKKNVTRWIFPNRCRHLMIFWRFWAKRWFLTEIKTFLFTLTRARWACMKDQVTPAPVGRAARVHSALWPCGAPPSPFSCFLFWSRKIPVKNKKRLYEKRNQSQ